MRTSIALWVAVLAAGLDAPAHAGANLTPPALLPAHEDKESCRPGIAFGKDAFLVVWQAMNAPQNGDLVACRVDKTGKALDTKPFVVSDAADDQERPKVAFGGGVFLVVWGDLRSGKCYEVYGARVSPQGKILDAGGVLLNSGKDLNRYMPAAASVGDGRAFVVWCGTKFWVGWGTSAGSLFVKDGKVEKDNAPLEKVTKDRNGSPGGGGRGGTPMSVAAGKEGYLVLWRNHRPVGRAGSGNGSNCALFVDREGKFKNETLNLTGKPHVAMDPDAAWDGSGFVAAWTEQPSVKRGYGTHEVVVAARTDAKGKPAGGAIPVAGSFAAPANRAAVASDGKGTTLIAYEQHPETAKAPIRIGVRLLK